MNVVFVFVAAGLIGLHKRHCREAQGSMDHEMGAGIGVKQIIALLFLVVLVGGLVAFLVTDL